MLAYWAIVNLFPLLLKSESVVGAVRIDLDMKNRLITYIIRVILVLHFVYSPRLIVLDSRYDV